VALVEEAFPVAVVALAAAEAVFAKIKNSQQNWIVGYLQMNKRRNKSPIVK